MEKQNVQEIAEQTKTASQVVAARIVRLIEYSAREGFRDVDFEPAQDAGESEEAWLKRAGFLHWIVNDGLESDHEYGLRVKAFLPEGETTSSGYHAMVLINDGCDGVEYVVVRTRSDLLQLRMALAPLHSLSVMQRLDWLVTVAEKAFCAWHEHEAGEICRDCAPGEARRMRERRKRHEAEETARIAEQKARAV